jgi:hypothetical protein
MEAKSTSRRTPALLVREPVGDSVTGMLPLDGGQSALWDLAAKYLERLSLAERRGGGRVYTPVHLVTFILEQARYHKSAGEPDATLLDPACGGGAFLVAAVVAIAERLRAEGKAPDREMTGASGFSAPSKERCGESTSIRTPAVSQGRRLPGPSRISRQARFRKASSAVTLWKLTS